MPAHLYVFLILATVVWALPFPLARSRSGMAFHLDKRARWGVALQAIGYSILWQGKFWTHAPATGWQAASLVLFVLACWLSWTGAFTLGKHLRVDAALAADHELVRSGPYRFVRHPIYASMFAVILATGCLVAPWYLFLAGTAVFLIGTEIRIRSEDRLLEARFGDTYRSYRRDVRGYVPLVR